MKPWCLLIETPSTLTQEELKANCFDVIRCFLKSDNETSLMMKSQIYASGIEIIFDRFMEKTGEIKEELPFEAFVDSCFKLREVYSKFMKQCDSVTDLITLYDLCEKYGGVNSIKFISRINNVPKRNFILLRN